MSLKITNPKHFTMAKPFVFNDQNRTNSYGFRILTAGIDLKRFNDNPVMLDQHYNSTKGVLGKWENIRVEKDLLLGEPVFDLEDEDSKKVSRKVEQGFIKSCSMGFLFKPENIKIIGTELIMEACELIECSIVAVPSNANSIRLYAENGELLKEDVVQKLCLALQPELPVDPLPAQLELNPNNDMKKIILSVATLMALSFDKATPEVDVEAVEAGIMKLSAENTAMKAQLLAIESAKETAQETAITEMVTLAITEGRIVATKKDDFVNLAKLNFELAKSTLASLPVKATLADKTIPVISGEVTTLDQFEKLTHEQKLAFKETNLEGYKKLFN